MGITPLLCTSHTIAIISLLLFIYRHFVDAEPTLQNPLPTMKLGYNEASKRVKRMLQFEATKHVIPEKKRRTVALGVISEPEFTATRIVEDPDIPLLSKSPVSLPPLLILVAFILGLFQLVRTQYQTIVKQRQQLQKLKQTIKNLRNNMNSEQLLQCDKDVLFYTGFSTKSLFHNVHSFISPFINRRWTGVTSMMKNIRKFRGEARYGPERKLTSKCEFLLMLMKLRLGLLNADLAKRFGISECLVSRIFLAWLRASSTTLKAFVYLPDEAQLISTKPERFRKLSSLHSIIDCTEIFIETPKDLYLQSSTWSDYKHHNTLKLLVACSPNSAIIFVSKVYLGRISDKAITLDSKYLDLIPIYSMVMADKGFNIKEECASRNLSLYVPPGRRGISQMPSDCVRKTKKIANLRILIEQVIRRLKTFRILANEIPISSVPHIDDIVIVCSAICNMKAPIYKT